MFIVKISGQIEIFSCLNSGKRISIKLRRSSRKRGKKVLSDLMNTKFANKYLINRRKNMKTLLFLSTLFCCLAVSQYGYSDYAAPEASVSGSAQNCCPPDAPCDQRLNDCYCLYVHYEPCYYTTNRCEKYDVPCKKKCYRKVPQYYEVQRCKMVPQYYCETKCRYCTECYEVDDVKCCERTVCDTHCKYVPRYYWKHTCDENAGCTTPAPCCPAVPARS